jgi:hypothetical protein
MKTFGPAVFLLLLTGCGWYLPDMDKVETSFREQHPKATVLGVSGQLTNGTQAQFSIYYTNTGDNRKHEDVWHYYRTAERWMPGKKESVR